MKKFIVSVARIEHQIFRIEVEARNKAEAEELAFDQYGEGDIDEDDYEVVHAEEFVSQVEEAKGETA